MTILKALAFIFLFCGCTLLKYALVCTYENIWSLYFLWCLYFGGQMFAMHGLFSPIINPIIDPILARIEGNELPEGDE